MTVGYFSTGKFTTDEWEKWVELYQIFISTLNQEETLKTNRLANDTINLEIFKNRIDCFV